MSQIREQHWELAFAARLKETRDRLGWSQAELARRAAEAGLKFHQTTVQRIETDARPVRLNEAVVLARLLGQDLERMIRPSNVPTAEAELRSVMALAKRAAERGGVTHAEQYQQVSGILEQLGRAHELYVGATRAAAVARDEVLEREMSSAAKTFVEWRRLLLDQAVALRELLGPETESLASLPVPEGMAARRPQKRAGRPA